MSVKALRAENAVLREHIQHMKEQLEATNHHIDTQDENNRELILTHHRERMVLLGDITDRLDAMRELHTDVARQMNVLRPLHKKDHGFAVTMTAMSESGNCELRLIAGQQRFVERRTTGIKSDEYLFRFIEAGNPIALRRNFQREASKRLRAKLASLVTHNPNKKRAREVTIGDCTSRETVPCRAPLKRLKHSV
ncbi:hypothetical protein F444_20709 [Phytophthora nicotianae P1976]|uniref:Uncharacterized protein n=1 Tax=Phytophthora nicotianae P1976 TaxID=1317066 RepID=A0A080Z3P1_PHYNI|nr:hypothetical protein F444_20709 [Phytophthora nicotianae P1976]